MWIHSTCCSFFPSFSFFFTCLLSSSSFFFFFFFLLLSSSSLVRRVLCCVPCHYLMFFHVIHVRTRFSDILVIFKNKYFPLFFFFVYSFATFILIFLFFLPSSSRLALVRHLPSVPLHISILIYSSLSIIGVNHYNPSIYLTFFPCNSFAAGAMIPYLQLFSPTYLSISVIYLFIYLHLSIWLFTHIAWTIRKYMCFSLFLSYICNSLSIYIYIYQFSFC